jgi:hypothetical protein
MSQLEELLAAERAEEQKRHNAPNDQKTRDLFPLVQSYERRIANGRVKVKAVPEDHPQRAARVLLRVIESSVQAPQWLRAGDGYTHNDLLSARFVNGKYHLESKTANGTLSVRECDTAEETMKAMEAYVSRIP